MNVIVLNFTEGVPQKLRDRSWSPKVWESATRADAGLAIPRVGRDIPRTLNSHFLEIWLPLTSLVHLYPLSEQCKIHNHNGWNSFGIESIIESSQILLPVPMKSHVIAATSR
jgi:hypothetical protein